MTDISCAHSTDKLRTVEFFSGIGGWRCALELSTCEYEIVSAFDINTLANDCYSFNFNQKPSSVLIESVPVSVLDKLEADIWVMSPPCQPYTRNNTTNTRDSLDKRSSAFMHLTNALLEIKNLPKYILLENVVGFETSSCCEYFLNALDRRGYKYCQFILNTNQFGIPNQRPRYYCTATITATSVATITDSLITEIVDISAGKIDIDLWSSSSERKPLLSHIPGVASNPPCIIGTYLDDHVDESLWLSVETLQKSASWCLDIVVAEDTSSACFTKAYSRFMRGSGSVLLANRSGKSTPVIGNHAMTSSQINPDCGAVIRSTVEQTNSNEKQKYSLEISDETLTSNSGAPMRDFPKVMDTNVNLVLKDSEIKSKDTFAPQNRLLAEPTVRTFDATWSSLYLQNSTSLCSDSRSIRYFSDKELLRIFGFPSYISFPAHLSNRKRYELIGNSLNVTVARYLIAFLVNNINDSLSVAFVAS